MSNVQVYELYGWYDKFLKMENKNSVLDNFSGVETVKKMKKQIKFLETKWADEQSVYVLNGLVHYLETKDWNNLAEICTEEEQYFIPEVRAAIKMPLNIIDAGAYRGELLQNLKNNQIYFKKWYCFEADTENFSHLLEQSRKNGLEEGRQICVNKGLWSESGRLFFESRGNESRIVTYETDDVIDVVSIDDYFGGESCSYIKMDIEGAELPALRGVLN